MNGLEYCLGIPGMLARKTVISALSLAGLHCVGESRDCPHFLRLVRSAQPQLAILELSLPGNVWETAAIIDQESLAALLILENKKAAHRPPLAATEIPHTVLTLPVSNQVLAAVVDVLYREFQRRRNLQSELLAVKERLQGRIIIEQAKGMVMKKHNLDEQQAYRMLQKKSMELRMPLEKLAWAVLQGNI
ncbi:MAG TPA: hypothetical protein DCQ14_00970 [Firmicutes bacterium]|nr:hypothetical protein [Bacillota bacterium]